MTEGIRVVRNDAAGRYEIVVDGAVVGFAEYAPDEQGRWVMPRTEIDPAFGGRGLGATLVGEAVRDAAARGETVVPVCPFVVKYLERHDLPGLDVEWPSRDAAPDEPRD